MVIQASVPPNEKPLPVSSSIPPEFPEAQTRLFREVLILMNEHHPPKPYRVFEI